MPLPNKRIKKIKLPNSNEAYEIIPEKLQSNGYQVELPELAKDDVIVTLNTVQTISGNKTFTGDVTIAKYALNIQADNSTTYTGDDWDASFYPDKVQVSVFEQGGGGNDTTFTLRYPQLSDGQTRTFATTSDLTEIVDLTQINNN